MPTRSRLLLALVLSLVTAGCVAPGQRQALEAEDPESSGLQPTFAPATSPASPPPATTPDAQEEPGGTPDAPPAPAPPTSPSPDTTEVAAERSDDAPTPPASAAGEIRDPAGDVTTPLLADPPEYADLRGARLRLDGDEATLQIQLGGGAPERSPEDHTLNVASFYDIDGDGGIDYEVWANLSPSGWGTSWFDNREGRARFGADDRVEVEVADGELVLRFPVSYLGQARAFRWSLATEWGTYDALATGRTSRDYAPDEGRPAAFPD